MVDSDHQPAMNLRQLFMFLVLLYVSYRFLVKYSKGEHEELILALQQWEHNECPTGITLYRLKSNFHLYRIQVQSKLPHDPTVTFRILKRCETFDYTPEYRDDKGDNHPLDKDATERNHLKPDEYVTMDRNLDFLVDDACGKMVYVTEECEKQSPGELGYIARLMTSSPFAAYLLEVVKGPETLELTSGRNTPLEWSFQTLVRGIFPGTLWCGFGNIADDTFGQLGDHADTDDCCRSHDLCKPIINAFQTRYYFSNPSVVPISHCGCDMRLYNCLRRVNSQASNTIGKIFFNIAKMKCFDFDMRRVCTWSFLCVCFKYDYKCIAILKNNKVYPT